MLVLSLATILATMAFQVAKNSKIVEIY
jgi:hypothetical protein